MHAERLFLDNSLIRRNEVLTRKNVKSMVSKGRRPRALGLLSGGLDSSLAVKLILDQGLEVEALNFVSPFCLCGRGGCGAVQVAKNLNVPLKTISVGEEYLKVVRKPRFGYGRNMNPCIDCRIFMLKKAKRYAKETRASFIFTGEVVGQRPMSQKLHTLGIIEEKSGLKGKIVRPLSARLLPPTEAEKRGLVSRDKFLEIEGRARKTQIRLARELSLTDYSCPSGGCLLTYREFACKLKDLFDHKKRISVKDVQLLKIGRHFRFGENKIIVGRNEAENNLLSRLKMPGDYCLEAQDTGSPITLLQGPKTKKAVEKAVMITAFYSDKKQGYVSVRYGKKEMNRSLRISAPKEEDVQRHVQKLTEPLPKSLYSS
jgi:tRNA-uridine 2-sulfurtransferase